ncbi:hypothetical protein JGH11_18515 [Dysgonomonas sp. Marseille-P4677]|uniref:hypothetical protein n=1 Tax=Dysgonomonas sp. Marseille-P4677 TaxID=2364790 RepID=UPI0019131F08|nr:hypothetical protein [Dysgonomonas sp. Marseille-P4677]MBK5722868.1 hypothetical protein [Dysgonomonas sp. Marseille-P4677]
MIKSDTVYDSGSHSFRYLDENGKWLGFYINPKGEFVENKSPDDVIMIHTWSLLNDGAESNSYFIELK